MTPLLTIVTVVKDDPDGFRRTLASMEGSRLDDPVLVEWLIVDSSRDQDSLNRTLTTSALKPTVIWVTPEGVYRAMNVGLDRATGEYIYFLNAGEEWHNSLSLSVIVDALIKTQPAWLYGQVEFVEANGYRVVPLPFDYQSERRALFARGRFPPHQGTVARTSVLKELGGFDPTFLVAADYAMALRLSQIADPLELQETIATFYSGGLSTVEWRQSLREFHRARLEILRPIGSSKVQELLDTARQFLVKGLHRARTGIKSRAH